LVKVYPANGRKSSLRQDDFGNDTIDRYPPACREIERILCVKEGVFRKLRKDFGRFLKANKAPKEKPVKKPKIKTHKTTIVPIYHSYQPISGIRNTHRHKIGRMQDWYGTYGQGMYE
jgi:hypothetical protein